MSEQLETIKCVDWTINFPGAVGGGADRERSPICRCRLPCNFLFIFCLNPQSCTWIVMSPSIYPTWESCGTDLLHCKQAMSPSCAVCISDLTRLLPGTVRISQSLWSHPCSPVALVAADLTQPMWSDASGTLWGEVLVGVWEVLWDRVMSGCACWPQCSVSKLHHGDELQAKDKVITSIFEHAICRN